ncbi:NPCBM/NEW2 domain-containing protein [Streptomyces sp. NBC_01335]|uniref:NPCBM/NEW2 domain-containing protein n=1 Tax=Streptomyces sp. NBC_01335 TaxID=2903828 RepID=UPI002E0D4414|nr:NPCBM/NEW2 domain-containing protein [Streptomyces sp. NBC_01335]WSI74764.1 NPCBM/NEW2 domain-containing protein [Streptomyces sp. NBC_01335]
MAHDGEGGAGDGILARRQARAEKDRLKAGFGARLKVLLDLTGLSSREFAARFPAYKDSTVRKYTLGTNLPPWDFLDDLLTEVARRTDDPAAPQRRTELFTAYRTVLIDTGADLHGSDQNSLLLRLLDGEETLRRLGVELAEVRGRENELRQDLEEELRRAQAAPGTGHQERRRRLEEEGGALAARRDELVHRRGAVVTELDDCRGRLAVMEAAEGSGDMVPAGTGAGAGAHQASVPPLPPGSPTTPAAPSKHGGRRPLVLIGAVGAVVLLAGGVAIGVWATGSNDADNRASSPERTISSTSDAPRTSTPTPSPEAPSVSATPAAPTAEQSSWSLIEDLVPMDVYPEGTDRSFTTGALTVNNHEYPATLYAYEAERTWQLGREYRTFTATAGVSDSTPSGDVITFTVQVDDAVVKELQMRAGDPVKKVSIPVSGAFRIKLTAQESFSTQNGYGAWIDPVVTK